MATMYDDVEAKCPFFIRSGHNHITCEGATENCVTVLQFEKKEKRNQHRRCYCDDNYGSCVICKMLNSKYEK